MCFAIYEDVHALFIEASSNFFFIFMYMTGVPESAKTDRSPTGLR